MTDGTNPPPGWYPDPAGTEGQRYWDGSAWTDQTRAAAEPTPSEPATPPPYTGGAATPAAAPGPGTNVDVAAFFRNTPRGLLIVIISAAVFLIATFLPWVTADSDFGDESENAWSGETPFALFGPSVEDLAQGDDGTTDLIVLLPIVGVAAGLAIAAARGNRNPAFVLWIVILGAAATLLMIFEWVSINGEASDLEDLARDGGLDVSAGVGFGVYLAMLAAIGILAGALMHRAQSANAPQGP